MAEVLSQKQIDELLGNLQSGSADIEEIEEQTSSQKIKDYDFLSPKKFTREQIRFLENIFENFARRFSSQLSGLLRLSCQAEVLQVEEEEFREFSNALNDSVLLPVLGLHSEEYNIEEKQILMEMSRPISFCIIDRLMGGNGSGYTIERDYTEIEISLMEYLFQQITTLMKDAWSNYINVDFSLNTIETNSQMIQFIQPDDSVAIVVVQVELNDLKGNLNICLPANSLEEIFKGFDSKYVRTGKKDDPQLIHQRRENIMTALEGMPLTISAILGQTEVTLRDLLDLRRGDIIPLDTAVSEGTVTVKVEKLDWFKGTVGMKKKNYAVKIEKVVQ